MPKATLPPIHNVTQEKEASYDYKTSDSVNNLLSAISEIIAHEYVETARREPDVFTDKTLNPVPLATLGCRARPTNDTKKGGISDGEALNPTLSLPLLRRGGKYIE